MPKVSLHDPRTGELRIAGFMSGSGTNLRKILEYERELRGAGGCPFRVVAIFSDSFGSNATRIGADFDIPVITRDIDAFYAARGRRKRDLTIRPEFDESTVRALRPYRIDCIVYAGYMSIVSPILTSTFAGLNVHPADLSIQKAGRRKYTGDHAVRDAILAGEKTIASSTHLVEEEVDGGHLLMISEPVEVQIPPGADLGDPETLREVEQHNQERLKLQGDWIIFPLTVRYIAEGRFCVGEKGMLFFDGEPVPTGVRVSEAVKAD
jgi:folate-dependent phosphoribosylglycinamide formyltransferase PurN